jgi:hypothetical protein
MVLWRCSSAMGAEALWAIVAIWQGPSLQKNSPPSKGRVGGANFSSRFCLALCLVIEGRTKKAGLEPRVAKLPPAPPKVGASPGKKGVALLLNYGVIGRKERGGFE